MARFIDHVWPARGLVIYETAHCPNEFDTPDLDDCYELCYVDYRYGRYGLGISFLNIPHSMTESGGDLKTDSETSARDAVEKECSMFGDACLQLLLDNIKDAADMGYI